MMLWQSLYISSVQKIDITLTNKKPYFKKLILLRRTRRTDSHRVRQIDKDNNCKSFCRIPRDIWFENEGFLHEQHYQILFSLVLYSLD
jgi:hypothetical protein